MRSLVSRLKRLERIERRAAGPRFVLHYGYLKKLPYDYKGPRHQITIRQIPPEELPPSAQGQPWFEWEERPGPGPGSESTCEPSQGENETLIRIQCVPCANRPMPPIGGDDNAALDGQR